MTLTFTNTDKLLTKSDLDTLEQRLGFLLPEEYHSFLLTYNGGIPSSRTFDYENLAFERQESNMIEHLYSLGAEVELFDLERAYQHLKEELAPGLLPIALLSDGSNILLSVQGSDKGTLHFFDYGQLVEPNPEEVYCDNVYPLANSLSEFFDSLYADSEE